MNDITIKTKSEEETLTIGRQIAEVLTHGTVIALYGDLGAGKTVISRGIARGLKITEPVTSPTFTVVQEYPLEQGGFLFHLDMYRINSEDDAYSFGIEDFLFTDESIALVEWPERIPGLLEESEYSEKSGTLYSLYLAHASESERTITMPEALYNKLPMSKG